MPGIRTAVLFSSAERYIGLAINFVNVAVISRLLTPTEIGIAAIGTALVTITISLREFATCAFLIQGDEVTRNDVQTAFTVQFLLMAMIGAVLVLAAPWIASLYGEAGLAAFIRVIAAALILDTFGSPILSLLRRDLAFRSLAAISVATVIVSAAVSITLAAGGFGFMSLAWAWMAATLTTVSLAIYLHPDPWIFAPSLACWRRALAFGGYNGAINMLTRLYEGIPQLVLGRVLSLSAVGLYNRTVVVGGVADKFILAGVFNVAFPALASEVRAGHGLKEAMLKAFCYITAFYWPALTMMALLAHPIVHLVLGRQWDAAAPLVQMIAVANLAWFPVVVTQPILMAVNAMRHAFLSSLIAMPVSALILCGASLFGVEAMVASQLLTTPFQIYVALSFARRHVPFKWAEVGLAVRSSAAVSAFSVTPALLIIAANGFDFDLAAWSAVLATVLAACGWMAGIWVTGHPVKTEITDLLKLINRHFSPIS
ncbi:MAG: oligosaccharide flippase family protein [Rhodospirillales bacterium]|nr:oligosaccharide flippase family protein [Rhodospirillales bacterium]